MQRIDGRLVLSPTDLTKHVACPHITTLDLGAVAGEHSAAVAADDSLHLVFTKGLQHEYAYLERLLAEGRTVEDIAALGLRGPAAEAATVDAMRRGVDVVYQATFDDGHWVGMADFLHRVDLPEGQQGALGPWRYDIADTKLARRLKVPALLQMATYAARLEVLQGMPPRWLTVVTGDSAEHHWRLVDVAPYARRRREELLDAVENPRDTASVRVQHCGQCRWKERCAAEWLERDDLNQVAGMRTAQRAALLAVGITTLAALAGADDEVLSGALSRVARARLRAQARLQLAERESGSAQFELIEPPYSVQGDAAGNERRVPRGLALLPAPDLDGDVYLDFEGDPWAAEGAGREYLAGVWTRQGEFVEFWAHDFEQEGQLTTALIDWLSARWAQYPAMHIYHYAPYETTALKRLASQHATREHELDQLLRAERFVDLYTVVRQGVRISKDSYSIKKLESFYWGQARSAEGQVSDGLSSVVEYERWLSLAEEAAPEASEVDASAGLHPILAEIRSYNIDDVRSTLALHEWLEQLRAELASRGHRLARPTSDPAEEIGEAEAAEIDLADRLVEVGTPQAVLLAGCVGWHRREDRPEWWEFFRYARLEQEELIESGSAIGGLMAPLAVGQVKQSTIWRYAFPPQDSDLSVGERAHDVDTHSGVGEVVGIDAVEGWVDLKIGRRSGVPSPRGLHPPGPLNNQVMRESLRRTGEALLSGDAPLGVRLLSSVVPSSERLAARPGESPTEVVVRVGSTLRGEVLAVQGPPGSGKTFAGAALIRGLLDRGLRVGVTALSHAVIRNLLDAVGRPALHRGGGDDPDPRVALTTGEHGGSTALPLVRPATNDQVVAGLTSGAANLVGGTAWLWSREELAGAVDVLVIDEAGQFSLANAVAVAQSAGSLVLLGDPQQLQQPTKAAHPYGSGASVLEHLIGEHDVIPADRGVFLDRTYRMHEDVTRFISELAYEGRLVSSPRRDGHDLAKVQVRGAGRVSGTGTRWVPVDHEVPSEQTNDAEAAVVRGIVDDLLRGSWTSAQGVTSRLQIEDVVVVAPYNAHVATLRRALPAGARVGTVDRFQGQEGVVVIYAMGSTSAALAPRGVQFLYDVHRLNVAISRARALALVVASPILLDAPVHTPEELRAVNALCRFVEEAAPV